MLMTGDIVLYQGIPYVFYEMGDTVDENVLVKIKYTETGWVHDIKGHNMVKVNVDSDDCRLLLQGSDDFEELVKKLTKYVESYLIKEGIETTVEVLESQSFNYMKNILTCELSELVKFRKNWRLTQISLRNETNRLNKEKSKLDSNLNGIAKAYDNVLLPTSEQLDVVYPSGTVVEKDRKLYELFKPLGRTTRGYLYDNETETITPSKLGTHFISEEDLETTEGSYKKAIQDYVDELDELLAIQTQINVLERIRRENATALQTEADKKITTYRKVFDELGEKLELEREKLEKAEKSTQEALDEVRNCGKE